MPYRSISHRVLLGSLAGVVGTFAMTLAKDRLFERLPARDAYPLPPREITEDLISRASGGLRPGDEALTAATIAAHFGFGTACAVMFTLLGWHRHRPALRGAAYGCGVWVCSYLGWIPAIGVLTPATGHPPRRNRLMILAHVIWGAAMGYAAATLERSERAYRSSSAADLKDRA